MALDVVKDALRLGSPLFELVKLALAPFLGLNDAKALLDGGGARFHAAAFWWFPEIFDLLKQLSDAASVAGGSVFGELVERGAGIIALIVAVVVLLVVFVHLLVGDVGVIVMAPLGEVVNILTDSYAGTNAVMCCLEHVVD